MNSSTLLGVLLVAAGIFLVVVGLVVSFTPRIPLLGKLPGDIVIEKKNFTFYFPIVTSIILSALLTLILWIVSRFLGR